MSHRRFAIRTFVALLGVVFWAAPATVQASDDDHDGNTGLSLMVGNDIWQPPGTWAPGDDWFAFACSATDCALEPARLIVRDGRRQGPDDAQPVDGQVLTFELKAPGARRPIAWLRGQQYAPWIRAGSIVSWGSVVGGLRPAPGPGTLELEAGPTGGPVARFVPLLDTEGGRCLLQLRSGDVRQILGSLDDCVNAPGTGYLIWAGDLDGDGRADYVVLLAGGRAELFLSGLAGKGRLVDAAIDDGPY